MLDKKLCKKCWGEGWGEGDEADWRDGGFVNCPASTHSMVGEVFCDHIKICDDPPVGCHMSLEYSVLKQEDKDE